jgi:hypothetical protein
VPKAKPTLKATTLTLVAALVVLTHTSGARLVAGDAFAPPKHLTLGCDGIELNAVILDCEGAPPYDEMSCMFTRMKVSKEDVGGLRMQREKTLTSTTRQSEASRQNQIADACKEFQFGSGFDRSKQGPAVQTLWEKNLQHLKALCDCKGKEPACVTRAVQARLESDEGSCTVWVSSEHRNTFRKTVENRWTSSDSSPAGCVASRTHVLNFDPQHSGLWTYTLNLVADPQAVATNSWCSQFKGATDTCSQTHYQSGLLSCEAVTLR